MKILNLEREEMCMFLFLFFDFIYYSELVVFIKISMRMHSKLFKKKNLKL